MKISKELKSEKLKKYLNIYYLKLKKVDLVNYIDEETGLTKADVTHVLDAIMRRVIKRLKSKESKATLIIFILLFLRKKLLQMLINKDLEKLLAFLLK